MAQKAPEGFSQKNHTSLIHMRFVAEMRLFAYITFASRIFSTVAGWLGRYVLLLEAALG
jgi:hypothetical protein